nr:hypothetical protein [uncultured Albidiferax sp.]
MISKSARQGFETLLVKSLQKSLSVMDGDRVDVTEVPATRGFPETHVVVLTSASYVFRVMLFIYFNTDQATQAHFARRGGTDTEAEAPSPQAFMDTMCEAANMCCGGFNRELVPFYPHIGLSTPNVLERRCADHITVLNAGLVKHFAITVNDSPMFHASLCVCDYDTLDFHYTPCSQEDTVEDGELELF